MLHALFSDDTKMADALLANGRLLYVFQCFDIELGFGEKTIGRICAERKISVKLFLLICNIYSFESYAPSRDELKPIPFAELVDYLQRSHRDYIETRIPNIIANILSIAKEGGLIDGDLIAAFCEKYRQQVVAHLQYEDEVLFPYIRRRLRGENPDQNVGTNGINHQDVEVALTDLKNVIVKYLPCTGTIRQCRPVLLELFDFDYELRMHSKLEDMVFLPLREYLEDGRQSTPSGVEFSERERQTLIAIARGLTNKQIAEKLNLSPHTVITHRRNIIQKTGIRTAQGFVVYALFNHFISKDDL